MNAKSVFFLLLLPQLSWAGPVIVTLGGNETILVAKMVGEFQPTGHLEMWYVETADLSDALPFEFTTVDTGILGPPEHGGGGGGGLIVITELPLPDGQQIIFENPVVWQRGYLESNNGEDDGPQLVQESLKMISGASLSLQESDVELAFFSDTEFAVTTYFRGVITVNYAVVPESVTLLLLCVGSVVAFRHR